LKFKVRQLISIIF